MSEHSNSGEVILAFLLGAIVGGAAGVLFAPAAGKKTRREIAKLMRQWLEEGEELGSSVKDAVSQKLFS
ncbi:MAG: YtxH domain-containing protein [Elusimicrobia bacterium]|nr:YtxH domain-containing protein [Elusimicrobiota bacterium]